VTGYLLDRDVLSAAEDPNGNRNVHNWIDRIPDRNLYISAVTVMEARKGFSRQRANAKTDAGKNDILGYEANFDDILAGYGDRILSVDRPVADLWGEMLGQREANVMDTALAATATVHGLVVATRNGRDFRGRGVRLVDPFKANPSIIDP
jgi:predicted nucleic acid-binding protein